MKSTELRLKKSDLVRRCHTNLEKKKRTKEDDNNYDAMWDEIQKLDDEITKTERNEYIMANAPISEPMADRRMAAYRKFLVTGNRVEYRSLQADADIIGGYMVAPEEFVSDLVTAIDDQTFIRQLATIRPVVSAASQGVPTLETDPADADWTSELLIGSEETTMTFGKRELTPKPLAKFIKVSKKLLRLNPKAESEIIQRLAYKFGVTFEKACLTGAGVTGPLGVFTASDDGISTSRDVSTGNTTTSIQTDGLKEAKYTLKGGYWKRASWIFHRDVVKQIAMLRGDDDQYLWNDSLVAGEPDTLLGFPVHVSEYAPSTFTTGQYVGILGDFKYYIISDALGFAVQRLGELFAIANEVGFLGRLESDGCPLLEEAFCRLKLG